MRILAACVSSASLFGCAVIIVSYARWPTLRSNSRFLLVCLSVGDYLNALGVLVSALWPPEDNDLGCRLQSVLTTCGSMLSFFWTSSMAIYLYIAIARENIVLANKLRFVFHAVCWIVPAAITGIALGKGKLGYMETSDTVGWCWIHGDAIDGGVIIWMVISGKGWEIISYVIVIVLYVLIKAYIWRAKRNPENAMKSSFDSIQSINVKLTFIPVVFVLLRMWGTFRFFFVIAEQHCLARNPFFLALHGVGDSSQGFANFIIFCVFTEKIRNKWISALQSCFCCCHENDSPHEGGQSTYEVMETSYHLLSQEK